jgi:hypothetical protein
MLPHPALFKSAALNLPYGGIGRILHADGDFPAKDASAPLRELGAAGDFLQNSGVTSASRRGK